MIRQDTAVNNTLADDAKEMDASITLNNCLKMVWKSSQAYNNYMLKNLCIPNGDRYA